MLWYPLPLQAPGNSWVLASLKINVAEECSIWIYHCLFPKQCDMCYNWELLSKKLYRVQEWMDILYLFWMHSFLSRDGTFQYQGVSLSISLFPKDCWKQLQIWRLSASIVNAYSPLFINTVFCSCFTLTAFRTNQKSLQLFLQIVINLLFHVVLIALRE